MNDADLEAVIRSGRVQPSAHLNDRVLRSLREAAAARGDVPPTRQRRRAALAAAAVLAGVAVVFAVDRLGRPAADGDGDVAAALDRNGATQDPVQRKPMPGMHGIDDTLQKAARVLLVERIGGGGGASPDASARFRVRAVFAARADVEAPACAVGDEIEVEPIPFSGRLGWLPRTVLDREDPRRGPLGSLWVIALDPTKDEAGAVTGRFRNIVGEGIAALPVPTAELPDGAGAKDTIRHLVVEGLGDDRCRSAALEAVRSWEGLDFAEPGDEIWRDPAAAERIVELTSAEEPYVRWLAGWTIPRTATGAGRTALRALMFDPVLQVRQPARQLLQRYGEIPSDEAGLAWDYELEEKLGPAMPSGVQRGVSAPPPSIEDLEASSDPAQRLWRLHTDLDRADVVELFVEALALDDPKARRAAAAGLAVAAGARGGLARESDLVGDALRGRLDDESVAVRTMAAAALYRRAERAGLDALIAGARGADLLVAIQCVDFLSLFAPARDKRMLDQIEPFAKDERPWVRAFAVAGIARCRGLARYQVEAHLRDARQDPSPIVRAAADARAW